MSYRKEILKLSSTTINTHMHCYMLTTTTTTLNQTKFAIQYNYYVKYTLVERAFMFILEVLWAIGVASSAIMHFISHTHCQFHFQNKIPDRQTNYLIQIFQSVSQMMTAKATIGCQYSKMEPRANAIAHPQLLLMFIEMAAQFN